MPWEETKSSNKQLTLYRLYQEPEPAVAEPSSRIPGFDRVVAVGKKIFGSKPEPKPIPLIETVSVEQLPEDYYKVSFSTQNPKKVIEYLASKDYCEPVIRVKRESASYCISLISKDAEYLLAFYQAVADLFTPVGTLTPSIKKLFPRQIPKSCNDTWAQVLNESYCKQHIDNLAITPNELMEIITYACKDHNSNIGALHLFFLKNQRVVVHWQYRNMSSIACVAKEMLNQFWHHYLLCGFITSIPIGANGFACMVDKKYLRECLQLFAHEDHKVIAALPEAQEPVTPPSAIRMMLTEFTKHVEMIASTTSDFAVRNPKLIAGASLLACSAAAVYSNPRATKELVKQTKYKVGF